MDFLFFEIPTGKKMQPVYSKMLKNRPFFRFSAQNET